MLWWDPLGPSLFLRGCLLRCRARNSKEGPIAFHQNCATPFWLKRTQKSQPSSPKIIFVVGSRVHHAMMVKRAKAVDAKHVK